MSLITLLVILIVFAVIFWLLNTYVFPRLTEPIKTIVIILVVIIAILILLSFIGIGPGIRL